jgi:hypothetical protein
MSLEIFEMEGLGLRFIGAMPLSSCSRERAVGGLWIRMTYVQGHNGHIGMCQASITQPATGLHSFHT